MPAGDAARALAANGANLDLVNEAGATPLVWVALGGQADVRLKLRRDLLADDLLQRSTTCCNTSRPVATRHNLLQRSTTCCNAAQPVATPHGTRAGALPELLSAATTTSG